MTPWTAAWLPSGFPVIHYLLEFTQTHIHWVSDTIQPSRPLLSPSPSTLNVSQHQGLLQWISSSHQMAKVIGASASVSVLPMNIWGWFTLDWLVWSCSPGDSQESSPAPQFESINSLVLSLPYGLTFTSVQDYWQNYSFDYTDLCWQSDVSAF